MSPNYPNVEPWRAQNEPKVGPRVKSTKKDNKGVSGIAVCNFGAIGGPVVQQFYLQKRV